MLHGSEGCHLAAYEMGSNGLVERCMGHCVGKFS